VLLHQTPETLLLLRPLLPQLVLPQQQPPPQLLRRVMTPTWMTPISRHAPMT